MVSRGVVLRSSSLLACLLAGIYFLIAAVVFLRIFKTIPSVSILDLFDRIENAPGIFLKIAFVFLTLVYLLITTGKWSGYISILGIMLTMASEICGFQDPTSKLFYCAFIALLLKLGAPFSEDHPVVQICN